MTGSGIGGTDDPDNVTVSGKPSVWLFIGIGAGVLIVAGGTAVLVIAKKKAKKEEAKDGKN